MSSVRGPQSGLASPLNRFTECANISKSIKVSAMIVLILIVLALILLVSAVLVNYLYKINSSDTASQADKEKRKKAIVGGLTITSAVVAFLATFAAFWQMGVASKAVKACIA
ncbi:putative gp95-like protein [Esparto virus]|uniref:Putative gp95-like protein n=1 Tax=Esparto virus TaxID=2072209 RepID=A0A2I7G313_9VIRU|nr:putative gp95-like protein [Esparto virus]AUQ44021.1 putative gp95-like protein [Esparto virus]